MNNASIFCSIVVCSITTIILRFIPFIIFQHKVPDIIIYLGKNLPKAIMAMLVIYCLRNTTVLTGNHGVPEMVSLSSVFILHKWKHNTIITILVSTIIYMILVQGMI